MNLFICQPLFADEAGMAQLGRLLSVFFTVLRTPYDAQPGGFDDPKGPSFKLGLRQKVCLEEGRRVVCVLWWL